ncbi:glycosyltransferase family 4 protein [Mucilaginibacter sp. 14171R-50]|uniref:glycosyltransferase family 4 protein n=1 Tax=Mucilaginibacter sp. 14171R-50 TaxID=2703789 RepID=UPI00138B38B0|nr:glycosyltransferase family 4 protein [Mucilaginibacter sp. 14171R-50]QHS54264.1 glycosyltransferase family 4 protein [Mucilaginibacter sp. 14171R-50]
MKRILYLSFYFEPDLCAGSFRNSPLAKELARQAKGKAIIDVITTVPNRYSTFNTQAPAFEEHENITVNRILIPKHNSGFTDQINSFKTYFFETYKIIKGKKYDMVFASSSRLFTAYLGYSIARKQRIPLYLDIRDIFIDTMQDVLKSKLLKTAVLPVLKQIEKKVFNYATHINLISGGFESYFEKYNKASYSSFSNGIDPEFLHLKPSNSVPNKEQYIITYAGNMGEGQGLHKIIPQAAKLLGDKYKFLVIGDGGVKQKLVNAITEAGLKNIELRDPVSRKELLDIYDQSDFLFLHLNDYKAFEKVLPSKIFELAAYDKPIVAGVAGFANRFIADNVPNRILFLPGDAEEMVKQLNAYEYKNYFRVDFLKNFTRENINANMAKSILSYLK